MTPRSEPTSERSFERARYSLKRPLDVALSLFGLTLLLLPLAVISLLVLVTFGRPILFKQQRPGLRARPFTILKFRTMRQGTGPDAERLTRFGRLLRMTSLDELPELWNVLRGDMSLVGPRPLLLEYVPFYTEREMKRFDVLPGITGWAQIHGRNAPPWDERLARDAWYAENQSLGLDMRILWMTIGRVLRREGIQEDSNLAEDRRGLRRQVEDDPHRRTRGESA
jgi:sugar transferase EpsL